MVAFAAQPRGGLVRDTPAGASFDPTGAPSPVVLGASENKPQPGYLESPTAAANPFYYVFDSLPDRTYDIYQAASPAGPWGEPVRTVTAEDYVTIVLLPKPTAASSAFFKTVLRAE